MNKLRSRKKALRRALLLLTVSTTVLIYEVACENMNNMRSGRPWLPTY